MPRYLIDLEGSIEVDADSSVLAEDIALAILHSAQSDDEVDADIDFNIVDVVELDT